MRACAEVTAVSPRAGSADPAELRKNLESRAGRVGRLSPLHEAHAAQFAAELSRADGRKDLACWDAAAAAWEAVSQPWPLAYALWRAAGIATAAGDRDQAASRLQRAAELAGQLRAHPLQQQISQLARRARIPLASPSSDAASSPGAPFGLTGREQDVLQLIAAGRTNREIAAELFISPSTASVHVSNILGKLKVASRGEAAAAAHRLHLFDNP
jgi:ATP/maltotriose-dependent transcriptional regulator MalT